MLEFIIALTQGRRLIQSLFYTGFSPGNLKQQAFLNWIQNHGYRVVSKLLTIAVDGTRRADLMVEIAVDMLLLSEQCDTIILVSNNETLAYAVNAVANKGTQIELVDLRRIMGSALMNLADLFLDMEPLKLTIQRE